MKNIKRILSLLFTGIMVFSAVGCAPTVDETDIGTPPDYSAEVEDVFDFYGYHAMYNGVYFMEGEEIDIGKDFRLDLDYYKDYAACGMTRMFFQPIMYQYAATRGGGMEKFEDSLQKQCMDLAWEAGIKEGIIIDWRIYRLTDQKLGETHLWLTDDLEGKTYEFNQMSLDEVYTICSQFGDEGRAQMDYRFETKSKLVDFVGSCLREYEDHPNFYSILLHDEPTIDLIQSSADIFEAVRIYNSTKPADAKKVEISQIILPYYGAPGLFFEGNEEEGMSKADVYRNYVETYVQKTGAKNICPDYYPIKPDSIEPEQLNGLRINAEVAEKYGIDFNVLMQTWAWRQNAADKYRICQKDDLYWQVNMLMGFGVDAICYYTYGLKSASNYYNSGTYHPDNSTFINYNGEKTDVYYNMQTIMGEMKGFEKVIRNFDYKASATYKVLPLDALEGYTYTESDPLAKIKEVKLEQGDLALVNELYDDEKGNYMYLLQNIHDPSNGKYFDTTINAEITFDDEYNYVAVYYKGEVSYHKLVDHKYSTLLSAGYAEFLLPY